MASASVKILFEIEYRRAAFSAIRVRRMLRSLCERFGITQGTISIAVVDDKGIVQVNRRFLRSAKRTDVISFDLSDEDGGGRVFEIIVNGERAGREASTRGHGIEAELALYMVHGFLHNVGFDDLNAKAARRMHETEDEILEEFGYPTAYAGDTHGKAGRKKST